MKQPILDQYRRPIGWITDRVDGAGRIIVYHQDLRVAGYIDTHRDVTMDAQYRVVSRGSVPGLLLR